MTSHGFAENEPVQLVIETGALPTGLSVSTTYYCVNTSANTFQLATSQNGAAIDVTDAVGTFTIQNVQKRIKSYIDSAVRTMVDQDSVQDMSNKTFDSTCTIDASAIIGSTEFEDDEIVIQDTTDNTKELDFDVAGSTGTKTTLQTSQTTDKTVTLPDATDTLVGKATTDTLTNKTIGDSNTINAQDDAFTIDDASDATKQIVFDAAGTTGTKTTITGSQTVNRVITIPDATDTLVGKATTDILSNKSFSDSTTFSDTTSSTTKDTGAVIVEGGVGIEENLNVGGDVTITGDLQVDGTTTTLNTTTLDVEDANITVNNGGNQTAANTAVSGITVEMSDATDARIGYDSTSATKFKAGESGSEVDLVGDTSTQTLTNKTIVAASNTITTAASGTLAATELNAALAELESEKQADMSGTTDEITLTGATIGLSDNPVIPGTDAMVVPVGTTAQQVSTTAGAFRYNSDTGGFEGYTSSWGAIGGAGGGGGALTQIKTYKAFDDSDTDWTVKSAGLEASTSQGILPDFDATDSLTATFVATDTGEALFTNDDADAVYSLQSAANSRYDAIGVDISIPTYARGKDIGLSVFYRTADTSGDSANADYMLWIFDQTNGKITTTTSTGAQSAGSSLIVGSSTGMSVGDKIWIGETGGTNGVTETHITAIADSTHVTLSDDVNLTSGDRFVTGILSDALTTFDAADSDSNNIGEEFKVTFLPLETTASVSIMVQQMTMEDDSFIFFDAVALDSDPFRKISTQSIPETFALVNPDSNANFWDAATDSSTFDITMLSLDNSKYLKYDDTTQTRIVAKQKVTVIITLASQSDAASILAIYNSSGEELNRNQGDVGSGHHKSVSASTILEKDDYIYFRDTNPAVSRDGGFTITATPLVNQSVIVESTDSVISEWADYTPVTQGIGTPTITQAQWRRVGTDMEINAVITTGTVTAVEFQLGLPSGNIVGSVLSNVSVIGSLYKTTNETDDITMLGTSGDSFLNIGIRSSGSALPATPQNGNILPSSNVMYIKASVPIAGWSATPKPLLAFPTITVGQEPEYYYIPITGNFWDLATNTYTFDTSLIPLTGSNLVEYNDTTETRIVAKARIKLWVTLTSIQDAGANLRIHASNGNVITDADPTDSDTVASTTSMILEAGDYIYFRNTNPDAGRNGALQILAEPILGQTNQAAVIAQPVAFVEDRKTSGTNGGTSSATESTRDLNTLSGEIAAVGVQLDGTDGFKFTEDCKVLIEWSTPFYKSVGTKSALYNETTANHLAFDIQTRQEPAGNGYSINTGSYVGIIKAEHILAINYEVQTGIVDGLGLGVGAGISMDSASNYYELFTQVKITRLK